VEKSKIYPRKSNVVILERPCTKREVESLIKSSSKNKIESESFFLPELNFTITYLPTQRGQDQCDQTFGEKKAQKFVQISPKMEP
jgi:hypothetical protein